MITPTPTGDPLPFLVGIVAALSALAGHLWAQIIIIVLMAVVGSLWGMSYDEELRGSWWKALSYVLLGVALALCLTGVGMWALQAYADVPEHVSIMPTALGIAAGRVGLWRALNALLAATTRLIGAFSPKGL